MATVVAYIDGFNLYYGMRAAYRRRYQWLDVVELVRRLRPKDQVAVVRYFTALVRNEPLAQRNQREYLDALTARHGSVLDIRLGRFKDRQIGRCKRCHQDYLCACPRRYKSYEEKETDVSLGASMVEDAALGVGDITLVVSADSDLAPAIAAIKRITPSRPAYLAMPPGNMQPSRRFVNIGYFHINEATLKAAQLPAIVAEAATGRLYGRPAKWK